VGTSERDVEINPLTERLEVNRGLGGRGEGTLGTLTSGMETMESTNVRGNILVFALKRTKRLT
jgi:hypothetical protein